MMVKRYKDLTLLKKRQRVKERSVENSATKKGFQSIADILQPDSLSRPIHQQLPPHLRLQRSAFQ